MRRWDASIFNDGEWSFALRWFGSTSVTCEHRSNYFLLNEAGLAPFDGCVSNCSAANAGLSHAVVELGVRAGI